MQIKTIKMDIKGMTCDGCATTIEKLLNVAGIVEKQVSFPEKSADVSFDAEKISLAEITAKINGKIGRAHV